MTQGFGTVLARSEELWEDSLCCGLIFRTDVIEKDPASFQKLLDGYFAAGEKLDKKEALRVAEEYLGQDAATLETSLDWISYQDLAISEEAIYLADRVVILDANPGQIKAVLTITLGKHRDRTSEDFLAIRDQIFEIFHMKREDAIEYYI